MSCHVILCHPTSSHPTPTNPTQPHACFLPGRANSIRTIRVLQRLLLLRGLRDDLDQLAVEGADLLPIAEEELQDQAEMLALIRI